MFSLQRGCRGISLDWPFDRLVRVGLQFSYCVCSFEKIVLEFGFGHERITPWKARRRWAMLTAKKHEDEELPNPRFKKRKEIYLC